MTLTIGIAKLRLGSQDMLALRADQRKQWRLFWPVFQVANVAFHEGSIRFPSVKEFIHIEVKGSPLADTVSDDAMEDLAAESERALGEFVVPTGEIVMPMDGHIVTARKA